MKLCFDKSKLLFEKMISIFYMLHSLPSLSKVINFPNYLSIVHSLTLSSLSSLLYPTRVYLILVQPNKEVLGLVPKQKQENNAT